MSTPTPTSSAPTDQPVAAPTETASPLLTPPATESTAPVDHSISTPAPASSDGDGIEFAPVDSSGTSRKEEPIRVVGPDSPQKGGSGATGPVEGEPYTWQDGDRTMTVKLQTDLVVEKESGGLPLDVVSANEGGTNVVRSADGQSKSDTLPVFRSESGGLMTLPGGVLLVLSPEWSQAETNAFFSNNGIKMDRVSELGYVANGFFVETGPGVPLAGPRQRPGSAGRCGNLQPQLGKRGHPEVIVAREYPGSSYPIAPVNTSVSSESYIT